MIFKVLDKITSSEFLKLVTSRLVAYAILSNLFLEALWQLARIYSMLYEPTYSPWKYPSFIWIMFKSGLYPGLIFLAFFVGFFIGQKRAFTWLLIIVGFYMAAVTLFIISWFAYGYVVRSF